METNPISEAVHTADRFYTQLKSINKFDEIEVKPVIDGLLSTTEEEICFIGTYHRARCHVDTALLLQHVRHFQTVAMIARSLFELAVDMCLLEVIPLGWMKMLAFVDVERLRCAQKVISFSGSNSALPGVSACKEFVATRGKSIDAKRHTLWPNARRVEHWSGHKLHGRVKQLGEPFESIYEGQYPRLSWSVHAGLTGVVNLKAETFAHMCSEGFKLSSDAYCEILKVMIRKFKLAKAHEGIDSNLQIARLYPWADTPGERSALDNSIR